MEKVLTPVFFKQDVAQFHLSDQILTFLLKDHSSLLDTESRLTEFYSGYDNCRANPGPKESILPFTLGGCQINATEA